MRRLLEFLAPRVRGTEANPKTGLGTMMAELYDREKRTVSWLGLKEHYLACARRG